MRIIGCGRRHSIPIVHPSAANRVEQLRKEIFRSVSHCFASIPLINRVVAPASLKVVPAHPLSIAKNRVQSALAAFKQFAYVHKKKWVATAAIGGIGLLVYLLTKRYIRPPINHPEFFAHRISSDGLKNAVHKPVSLVSILPGLSVYGLKSAVHETVSLWMIVCAMTATHWMMMLDSELKNSNDRISQIQKQLDREINPLDPETGHLQNYRDIVEKRLQELPSFMSPLNPSYRALVNR
ncbi:MAG: hypothetical protein RLZZ453_1216 [Chlamydiota bacterium]